MYDDVFFMKKALQERNVPRVVVSPIVAGMAAMQGLYLLENQQNIHLLKPKKIIRSKQSLMETERRFFSFV